MSTSKRPNWGIVSTGRIAEDFVYALRRTGATVSAVASRSLASANQFGDKFGIPTRYASYDELAGDADIDIVYIGTPHAFHAANAELFLQHGKSCLVEKPICVNASQLESLMTLAASKNLLLIEGMWTRCFPATQRLRELLESGAIGQVRAVQGACVGQLRACGPLFARAVLAGMRCGARRARLTTRRQRHVWLSRQRRSAASHGNGLRRWGAAGHWHLLGRHGQLGCRRSVDRGLFLAKRSPPPAL